MDNSEDEILLTDKDHVDPSGRDGDVMDCRDRGGSEANGDDAVGSGSKSSDDSSSSVWNAVCNKNQM